jgi:two-component system response regulator YesN
MYRLLIVDDEPFIVNGLFDMVERTNDLDVEVYKAYSAIEALEWLRRTKIDIVLTDINMPAIDGLELQRKINEQWPVCKIIFLTGYNDASFMKEALKNETVDYILKMEGNDAIRASIRKAIHKLDQELELGALVEKARTQLKSALPSLQRAFLISLLQHASKNVSAIKNSLDDLHISLDSDRQVMLITGRIDEWREDLRSSDRALLLYATQNISTELFGISSMSIFSFVHENELIVWFLQTNNEDKGSAVRFVHGTLERVQRTCKELLKLKISFASSSEFVSWQDLPHKYECLKLIYNRGLVMGQELLLFEDSILPSQSEHAQGVVVSVLLNRLQDLEQYLEYGQQEAFFSAFTETMINLHMYAELHNLRITVFYRMTAMFVAYLTKNGMWEKAADCLDLKPLLHYESTVTWETMSNFYYSVAEWIFTVRLANAHQFNRNVIHLIHKYIDTNLSGDLSLTRLGEVVAFNPVYLSRLYKQWVGENLTDVVAQMRITKAKELLKETNQKIQDIAIDVGFDSSSYFTRCFKKLTKVTPQEYRDNRIE